MKKDLALLLYDFTAKELEVLTKEQFEILARLYNYLTKHYEKLK